MKNRGNYFKSKCVAFGKVMKEDFRRHWILYAMLIPVVVYFVIFSYVPMYGITLAFKDFDIKKGILGSDWVGLKHFRKFVTNYKFWDIIRNTLEINIYSLLTGFPIPIIFALFLNHLKHAGLKKWLQNVSYVPHFISVVVMCAIIRIFFDLNGGIINNVLGYFGKESIAFLGKPQYFKDIYVWSGNWQGMGWSSIIYLSALSGVDPQLHDAAIVDGATKMQRIRHIDLPSILPTIMMLLILQLGSLMGLGFDKVYLLQNEMNLAESEVISTYVYKQGLINADYAYSTAVGQFNMIINLILLITANTVSKKVTNQSLF